MNPGSLRRAHALSQPASGPGSTSLGLGAYAPQHKLEKRCALGSPSQVAWASRPGPLHRFGRLQAAMQYHLDDDRLYPCPALPRPDMT